MTVELIRSEIAEGNLEKSIEMVMDYCEHDRSVARNEVFAQSCRLQRTLRDLRMGIVSDDSATVAINQITIGILDILDRLEENEAVAPVSNSTDWRPEVNRVQLELVNNDIANSQDDFIVLKYAQRLHGASLSIYERFLSATEYPSVNPFELPPGKHRVFTEEALRARVLFQGVAPISVFRYPEITRFTEEALRVITEQYPTATSVSFTMHGAGYGLDEYEALKSQILGINNFLGTDRLETNINRINIYELQWSRMQRMRDYLDRIVPLFGSKSSPGNVWEFELLHKAATRSGSTLDDLTRNRKKVVVSIPYTEEYEDVYTLGIQSVSRELGYLTERVDTSLIEAESLHKFVNSLDDCSRFLLEVSKVEPIHHLQLSYALVQGVDILLLHRSDCKPEGIFDRPECLEYRTITRLKKQLLGHLA